MDTQPNNEAKRLAKLRRMARRYGRTLHKARTYSLDTSNYYVVNLYNNSIEDRFWDLDAVEGYLEGLAERYG